MRRMPERQGDNMEVYFDCSLWKESGERECSCIQPVHARFTAGGLERIIPVIYCFEEGIVFDILTVLDEKVMRDYCGRFAEYEERAAELSDAEVLEITQQNPYHNVGIAAMWLNGCLETEQTAFSSIGYTPESTGDMEKQMAQRIRDAYPEYLEHENCFFCQRVQLETKEDWTKTVLGEIRMQTRKLQRTEVLDLEAAVKPGEESRITFVHPAAGIRHEVVIYDTELVEMPGIQPFYMGKAEVVPSLPEEEHILFDSSLSCTEPDLTGTEEGSDISLIGGAEGPTAIFIAAKCDEDGPASVFLAGKNKTDGPRYGSRPVTCFSKPLRKGKEGNAVFRILGLEQVVMEEEMIQVY